MADIEATIGLEDGGFRQGLEEMERTTDRHVGAMASHWGRYGETIHKAEHVLMHHAGVGRGEIGLIMSMTSMLGTAVGATTAVFAAAGFGLAAYIEHQKVLAERLKLSREEAEHFEKVMRSGLTVNFRSAQDQQIDAVNDRLAEEEKAELEMLKKKAITRKRYTERLAELGDRANEEIAEIKARSVDKFYDQKHELEKKKREDDVKTAEEQRRIIEKGQAELDRGGHDMDEGARKHGHALAELEAGHRMAEIEAKRLAGKEEEAHLDEMRLETAKKIMALEEDQALSPGEKAAARDRLLKDEGELEKAFLKSSWSHGARVIGGGGLRGELLGGVSAAQVFGRGGSTGSGEQERHAEAVKKGTSPMLDVLKKLQQQMDNVLRELPGMRGYA